MTVRQLWNHINDRLKALPDFRTDSICLIEFVTGIGPGHIIRRLDDPAPPEQAARLEALVDRRLAGEPLQYLIGEWEFYLDRFYVGEGVLIPRQDTETLVEAALEKLPKPRWKHAPSPTPQESLFGGSPRVLVDDDLRTEALDLCSGTGCVAISIAGERPNVCFTALEYSPQAFAYLEKNIDHAPASLKIQAVLGDLRTYTHPYPLDLITANPPYIPTGELANLQKEVRREPVMALDGGDDGLAFYRAIAGRYHDQLAPGGWLCLEVGAGQSGRVSEILAARGFVEIEVRDDYTGIPRVVSARRNER